MGKGKYVPPTSKKAKKALSIEVIEEIYNYKADNPEEAKQKICGSLPILQNGMNVKDIAFIKYENIRDGTLTFIREKTKHSTKDNIQKIEVFIMEDLVRIINKWGRKPKKPSSFILIFLIQKVYQIYKSIEISIRLLRVSISI